MSAARTASRAMARPAPRRSLTEVAPPPDLRLVDSAAVRRRAVTRAATVLATALATAGLFAVVALHVFLTSGQADLDRLQAAADAETARNGRLTVEVAQLESPDRVVGAARLRLGMVPPSTVVYLPAADPAAVLAPVAASPPTTAARPVPTTTAARSAPTSTTPGRSTPTTTVARSTSAGAGRTAPLATTPATATRTGGSGR